MREKYSKIHFISNFVACMALCLIVDLASIQKKRRTHSHAQGHIVGARVSLIPVFLVWRSSVHTESPISLMDFIRSFDRAFPVFRVFPQPFNVGHAYHCDLLPAAEVAKSQLTARKVSQAKQGHFRTSRPVN